MLRKRSMIGGLHDLFWSDKMLRKLNMTSVKRPRVSIETRGLLLPNYYTNP
jgi:hypothetical protein